MKFNIYAMMKQLLLLLTGTMILTSCEYKDLRYEEELTARVRIVFDWKKAPGVSVASMNLWMFPLEGGIPLRYEFPNSSGGEIDIPLGKYRATWMNNDSEVLQYRETEQWKTFEIFTRKSSQLEPFGTRGDVPAANPANEPTVLPPDRLWSGTDENVEILPRTENQRVVFYPENKLCTYTIEVRDAKNLQYISGISATISGLSGSFFPCTGAFAKTRSLLPFPCTSDGNSLITGKLLTFGTATNEGTSLLVLYMILADGSKWYHSADVSDQINKAPDRYRVHIVIDGLDIPKPIVNGGGFQPTLDDWEEINEKIIM